MAIKKWTPEQTRHPKTEHFNGHRVDAATTEAGRQVSEAVYWKKYYEKADCSYEWNNGYLELKSMPNSQQVLMYGWFLELLRIYLRRQPIAQLMFLEVGFRLVLHNKVTIRKPDLFIVRNDNPIKLTEIDRSYKGICDLAVEALSDSNNDEIERDTVSKKAEYESVGVKEYYVLDASGKHRVFYLRNERGFYDVVKPDEAGVIRSTVLPGFQFRVDDLYRQPSPIEMAEDPVYQAFVLPEYQVEKRRAERLAARLRALGLDDQ